MSKCEGKRKSGGRLGSQAMCLSPPHHCMGEMEVSFKLGKPGKDLLFALDLNFAMFSFGVQVLLPGPCCIKDFNL